MPVHKYSTEIRRIFHNVAFDKCKIHSACFPSFNEELNFRSFKDGAADNKCLQSGLWWVLLSLIVYFARACDQNSSSVGAWPLELNLCRTAQVHGHSSRPWLWAWMRLLVNPETISSLKVFISSVGKLAKRRTCCLVCWPDQVLMDLNRKSAKFTKLGKKYYG